MHSWLLFEGSIYFAQSCISLATVLKLSKFAIKLETGTDFATIN